LPKSKGRIKGFSIVNEIAVPPVKTDPHNVCSLEIAGIEVVKNVPVSYFAPNSTVAFETSPKTTHTFMFDESIEGGQTFKFTYDTRNATAGYKGDILSTVKFIFEDEE